MCEVNGNEDLHRENLEIMHCFDEWNIPLERKNINATLNPYGRQLIEFCKNNNIFMLNGRLDQDDLKLTCKNKSTVDYFLSTAHNFENISSFNVMDYCLLSDAHCPLSIEIKMPGNYTPNAHERTQQQHNPDVKLWDESKRDKFVENIDNDEISKINAMLNRILVNGQTSVEAIHEIIVGEPKSRILQNDKKKCTRL